MVTMVTEATTLVMIFSAYELRSGNELRRGKN